MNDRSLRIIEYDKVCQLLTDRAATKEAKELCEKLQPMTDINEIESAQEETSDALSRLFKNGSPSFGGIKSIAASQMRLKSGGILNAAELLNMASVLEKTQRIKNYGKGEKREEETDSLDGYFDLLTVLPKVTQEIRRCILSEDEIADDASSALRDVRRKMKQSKDKVKEQLNKMVNGPLRTCLQDPVITMRGDRYCLPVKSEYKSSVPGMVHDRSATGSTLFIEPAAVVNLNNELKELSIIEAQEIEKVLATLSAELSEHTEELDINYDTLIRLDHIFARGQLAMDMNAVRPIYSKDRHIILKKARHPLLDKSKVVPVDITLGDDYSLLVVTGPNTGGKTVSLKTCGLLAAMGQSGLHIPCRDLSELTVFDEIYADIGDEQSIEQSLSTFSSHMKNIIHILKYSTKRSLCLFDELCAGTDPTEGAALAIAILKDILSRGSLCMATTHYSELKVFALTTEGVVNGSCEFDIKTLSPTYRLLIGVPGKSNAFAISKRLGLPDYIIESAKSNIDESDKNLEDVFSRLEKSRIELEKETERAQEMRRQAQSYKDKSRSRSEKLEDQSDRIIEQAKEEARRILNEAKATADETIRNFQKYGSIDQIREMEKDRERIRSSIKRTQSASVKDKLPSVDEIRKVDPDKLKIGDDVRVLTMNVNGTVSTLPDQRGNLFVQCGILRSQVNVKDLAYVNDASKPEKKPVVLERKKTGIGSMKMEKATQVRSEIKLIGMNIDDAIAALDKYLDDVYLAGTTSVRIVHGKGTGALRKAVWQHLKRVKYVEKFEQAGYGEGDAGVTIAYFRQ